MPRSEWRRLARVSRWRSCMECSMRWRPKCSPPAEGAMSSRSIGSRSPSLLPLVAHARASKLCSTRRQRCASGLSSGFAPPTVEVTGLTTSVTYVPHADSDWTDPQFHVDFARVAQAPPGEPPSPLPRRIELSVVCGVAEAATYSFAQTRIDLGRCAQVRDVRHRLIRTNQIAFADDGADVNQSVSRSHAHVEYDATAGHYRLCDDRSAHGTGVLRRGRTLTVAAGSRGVRLQSGDEIVLGEARLRVTFDD